MNISPGTRVEVTTAHGERLTMVARSQVTNGRDMPVVWVSEEEEYASRGADAYSLPWPADGVRLLTPA